MPPEGKVLGRVRSFLNCSVLCFAPWCFQLLMQELHFEGVVWGFFYFTIKSSSSSFPSSGHAYGELQAEPLTGIAAIQIVDTLYLYISDTLISLISLVTIGMREEVGAPWPDWR